MSFETPDHSDLIAQATPARRAAPAPCFSPPAAAPGRAGRVGRRRGLAVPVSRQGVDLGLAELAGDGLHGIVMAGARLERLQLRGQIALLLAGEIGDARIAADPVLTMTGLAGGDIHGD